MEYTASGGGWGRGGATLRLSASDPAGFSVTITGDIGGAAFNCGSACDLPLPEGEGLAQYTAVSASGRTVSGSTSWRLDLHPPALQPRLEGGVPGDGGWYRAGPVTLVCDGSDALSGWGGAFYDPQTADGDGEWTLSCSGRDVAGNASDTHRVTVRIDGRSPEVALSPHWFLGSSGVVTGADSGSGIASSTVTISRPGMAPWIRSFAGLPSALDWDGTDGNGLSAGFGEFHVSLAARDVAGNETTVTAVIWNPQPSTATRTPFRLTRTATPTGTPTLTPTATVEVLADVLLPSPAVRPGDLQPTRTPAAAAASGVVPMTPSMGVVFPGVLFALSLLSVAMFFVLQTFHAWRDERRPGWIRIARAAAARRIDIHQTWEEGYDD